MNSGNLKLNSGKTECLLIGTRQQLQKVSNNSTLSVEDSQIALSCEVRNLGTWFDSKMSMLIHIRSIPHEKRRNDHFWNKLLWDFNCIAKMHKDWSFKNHQDISADPPFDTEGGTQSKRLLKDSYSGNNECNNLLTIIQTTEFNEDQM